MTKQSTTTVVTTGDATTVRTEPVTFTATIAPVAPATVTPAGAVAFNLSGIPISGCTARSVTAGVATCTTSVLPVGPALSITALYSGDATSATSTSNAISQAVAKATATTVISSSSLTSVFGESVTLTATLAPVAPATVAPTSGTVAFADGGIAIGTCDEQPITAGVATCTTGVLAIGDHTLTAIAAPTADFESSTSPAITQVVNRSVTHTALTPMDTPAKTGKSVRFHVAVTASGNGDGTPTGIVALYRVRANDSREWIGRASLRAGSATITVAGIPVGLHLIVAEYRGDADFGASHRSARQRIDR